MSGFQCHLAVTGDIEVMDGVVLQPRNGVKILTGSGRRFPEVSPDRSPGGFVEASTALGSTFIGGSGRNLFSTGLAPRYSSAPVPAGFFSPTVADQWVLGGFLLTVTGPDDATISDATDVVAILTTGGTAPVGDYDSTSYGAATYGPLVLLVGQPFTLTVTAEGTGDIPGASAIITAGTAQAGIYDASSSALYASAIDPDWTIVIDPSGSAELRYLTDVMATRAAGLAYDPAGTYDATALGMATYNLTTEEPVDGEPWQALVSRIRRAPEAGYAFLTITETAGIITAVAGPFFAGTLPAPAGDDYSFPLAFSDGANVEQYHTGAIIL